MKYPEIVEQSAWRYVDHLRRAGADGRLSGRLEAVVQQIVTTTEVALAKREDLSAADVSVRAADFEALDSSTVGVLINEWTLGFGNDAAELLVMGTEEAYSLEHFEDRSLELLRGGTLAQQWQPPGLGDD